MKSSKSIKWSLLFLGTVIVAIWGWRRMPSSPKSPMLNVGIVTKKDLIQRVTISGGLMPRHRLDVKPTFPGFVQRLYVKIGDDVKAGDPLVMFSPSMGRSESNYPVRASFSGRVTLIMKSEGEYVQDSGDQNLVLRVDDLSQLSILASVPELDVAKIKNGQKTKIKFSALPGETFSGIIQEKALSSRDKDRWSSSSTEFQIKIAIESHDPRLMPGMTALVDVITNRKDQVLTLSHEYIQEDLDGNHFVTYASGEKKIIELGLQTDEGVEIISGLHEGDSLRVIDFLNLPTLQD